MTTKPKPFIDRICQIIYYLPVVYIIACILMSLIINSIPLEFTRVRDEDTYYLFLHAGLPVAILLTTPVFIKKQDRFWNIFAKTLGVLLVAAVVFLFMALSALGDMCDYGPPTILFKNRANPAVTIVDRDFGCGATDGSPATHSVFQSTPYTPLFVRYTRIDTTHIDRAQWVRVPEELP